LTVTTSALAIQVADSAFEVTVGAEGTEVAVERGRLRVATPDDQREIELAAGQSAHAGGRVALAFRRAGGQPLEPVERIAPRALAPELTLAASSPPGAPPPIIRAAAERGSNSAAAEVESAVPIATAGPSLAPSAPATLPAPGADPGAATGLAIPPLPPTPAAAADAKTPTALVVAGLSGPAASAPALPAPGADPGAATAPLPPTPAAAAGKLPRALIVGGLSDPAASAPAPGADSSAASGSDTTPVPDPDPSGGADREDLQSPFDRLTERMLDGLPARGSEP
jgi:hypothetical protein